MIPIRFPTLGASSPRCFIGVCGVLSIAAAAACDRPKEPAPMARPIPAAPGSAAAPAAAPQPTAGVTWTDPARWQRQAVTSPMRKASYKIPKAAQDTEDGELSVFYFGAGQGGGIEANVDRWVGQFQGIDKQQVKRSNRSANGLVQHVVEIESGTFSSGMPGGPTTPRSGFALLGAIVEAPAGNWFFKLTGPSATVKKAHPEFMGMLDSVKAE